MKDLKLSNTFESDMGAPIVDYNSATVHCSKICMAYPHLHGASPISKLKNSKISNVTISQFEILEGLRW